MNISKFTLLSGGIDGVKIEAIEKMPHEKMLFLDQVTRTRKVPLSEELRDKIQNLKYFYLNLTSHWIAPFNKYFDLQEYKLLPVVMVDDQIPTGQTLLLDIWNHTKITGVTIRNGGFVITGTIEVVEGKKIGVATPFITEEDDLSFYMTAINKITEIMEDLEQSINTRALPAPNDKQMLISFGETEETIDATSIEEIERRVLDRLVDKGAIIMMDSDSFGDEKKEISDGSSKASLNTNTSSIDSHNMPDADEDVDSDGVPAEDEKTEYEKATTVKADKNSSLVSDAKFKADLNDDIAKDKETVPEEQIPEGGSLEELEYSQNMGMSDQGDGQMQEDVPDEVDEPKSQW
jgi:hypothetical protein